jgi:hypothetical protein
MVINEAIRRSDPSPNSLSRQNNCMGVKADNSGGAKMSQRISFAM